MIIFFIVGFLSGILFLLALIILVLLNVFGKKQVQDQFSTPISPSKTQIPPELKAFLRSAPDGKGSEWESCSSMSLLLHFLFQEHKETRQFRRWLYKKLQLELNDVTARSSAAGRIIQAIQIRDLDAGTNSPMVKNIRVDTFALCEEDRDMFEELGLVMDLDYKGGFQMSVDALMAFGKFAQLSVKLLHLNGRARLDIKRQPFAHWSFAFIENPQIELKIESQFQGRNLRHLIPLIGSAFRKALQLKHVWPNYKIRFRPFFQNPFFNPSPNIAAFEHINLDGTGLEVTVLSASRLNRVFTEGTHKIFCKLLLEKHPYSRDFGRNEKNTINSTHSSHILSVLLSFSRKSPADKLGLTFTKKNDREIRVEKLEPFSNAEKCGFRVGDCLVAVNNIPVRNERQALRLLTGTAGDLLVLVERELDVSENDQTHSPSLEFSETVSIPECKFDFNDTPPIEFKARDEQEPEIVQINGITKEETIFLSEEDDKNEFIELNLLQRKNRPIQLNTFKTKNIISDANTLTPVSPITPVITVDSHIIKKKFEAKRRHLTNTHQSWSFSHIDLFTFTRIENGIRRTQSDSKLCITKLRTCLMDDENLHKAIEEPSKDINQKQNLFSLNIDENSSLDAFTADKSSVSAGVEDNMSIKESEKEKHSTKRERFHNEMTKQWHAGRCKINEFLWSKRKPTELIMATEVNDDTAINEESCNLGKLNEKNKLHKKNKSPSPSHHNTKQKDEIPEKSNRAIDSNETKVARTKSVPMSRNPIWIQSVHFALQKELKYLNVLVYAENQNNGGDILLGYTSVYLPSLIDDCMLTLSNTHRERFYLKSPRRENEDSLSLKWEELSRHNGFDYRLCYGDVILAFRFFPDGLPEELATESECRPDPTFIFNDDAPFIELNATGIYDQQQQSDSAREKSTIMKDVAVIRNENKIHTENQTQAIVNNKSGQQTPTSSTPVDIISKSSGCRRRKLAEKLQITLKHVGGGYSRIRRTKIENERETKSKTTGSESPESPLYQEIEAENAQQLIPISRVLEQKFLESLGGLPHGLKIGDLRFEPGNSYNPQIVSEIKSRGQQLFCEYEPEERKTKINEQIDRLRFIIGKLNNEKLSMPDKTGEEFFRIENRLQALSQIMLMYCNGLSDCLDKEETAAIALSTTSAIEK